MLETRTAPSMTAQGLAELVVKRVLRQQVRKKARGKATDLRETIRKLAKAVEVNEGDLECFFMNHENLVPGAGEIHRQEWAAHNRQAI